MSKGLKRLLLSLITALALYSWLGFLMLPSVALQVINQQLTTYATTPAQLQRLEVNPFTLELNIWGLRVGESDDQQLSLQHLYAQVAGSSLWHRHLHLKELILAEPSGQVIVNPQGELNLTQLFNLPETTDKTEEPNSTPLSVLIDRTALHAGNLRLMINGKASRWMLLFRHQYHFAHLDTRPTGQSELHSAHRPATAPSYTGKVI